MALRRKSRPTGGEELAMTECPAPGCDRVFTPDDQPAKHFRYHHTPDDFGLTPLRGGAGA